MSVNLDITEKSLLGAGYRTLHAGDDYDYGLTIERSDVALNLTGATIWFTVKDSALQSDAAAQLQLVSTDSSQIEITDAVNGRCTIKFRGTGSKSTADLEGLWDYDIQVKLSAGTIITVATGKIEFLTNITRTTS